MARPGTDTRFPLVRDVGLTGVLVSFADSLSEAANRAALAFRATVEAEAWDGIEETAPSLTSVFLRFDPLALDHDALSARLKNLLQQQDWYAAPPPPGRRHWCVPLVLGGADGPQFDEAADLAGLSLENACNAITKARLRVLTFGFAPGQPYMGELPEAWNIPRMKALNPRVPGGALVVAIRQLIIFANPTPTGWRHIGQTAFRCFRPDSDTPLPLGAADEMSFRLVASEELAEIRAADTTGDGGATVEVIE